MIDKAFEEVLIAEANLGEATEKRAVALMELDKAVRAAEKVFEEKLQILTDVMKDKENHVIKGAFQNWKVSWSFQKGRVKIVDIDAVPEEFVKIEKKPMLNDIRKHLDEHGLSNWAHIEVGEPKLTWKGIKK